MQRFFNGCLKVDTLWRVFAIAVFPYHLQQKKNYCHTLVIIRNELVRIKVYEMLVFSEHFACALNGWSPGKYVDAKQLQAGLKKNRLRRKQQQIVL